MEGRLQLPIFEATGLRSTITEFALPLAAFRDDDFHPCGTAVVVAPYLALTARHVIEDYFRVFMGRPYSGETDFAIVAFQGLNEGTSGAVWSITRLWHARTDITFLKLEPLQVPPGHVWRS